MYHQKSITRDVKRLAYINIRCSDVLVHEYGLVNYTRRHETVSCVGHLQAHQQAKIYVRKEHLSLVRPRCTALEMPISYTFPSDCSTS